MRKRDLHFYREAVCLLTESPNAYREFFSDLEKLSLDEVRDLVSWEEPELLDAEITYYVKYNMTCRNLDLLQEILSGENFLGKVMRSKHLPLPYIIYDKFHEENLFIKKYKAWQHQYTILSETEETSFLAELPLDVLRIIVKRSDLKTSLNLRQACKVMYRNMMDFDVFWGKFSRLTDARVALRHPIYKRFKLIGVSMIQEKYFQSLAHTIIPKTPLDSKILADSKDILFKMGLFISMIGASAALAVAFSGPVIFASTTGVAIFAGIYAAVSAMPLVASVISLKTIIEHSEIFYKIKEFINSIKGNHELAVHYKTL